MEHYLVSARKYRPSTFQSVVGQKALTATLRNAVASGRLAHSYLFCGSRGVGKTSCARIFAKTINCEHRTPEGEACNECDSCRAFNEGTSMNIVELDAASNNGVDDIRELIKLTLNPPSSGRYRVFIVDEVHMLSQAAFNAFLKTLEEPPAHVIFILATTEKQKLLPTILSRCQIYDFSRITIQDMIDHLSYVASQEGIQAEQAALNVIARKADGAMRDALSIFDQVAASSRGNITYQSAIESLNVLDAAYYSRLLEAFLGSRTLESWLIYKEIRDKGFDSHILINGLAGYLRDLMAALSPQTLHLIEAGDDVRAQMQTLAARCKPDFLYRAMSLLNDADLHYRDASNKQFLTELTLAKICQLCGPSPSSGDGEGQKLAPIAAEPSATYQRTAPKQETAPAPAAAQSAPSRPVTPSPAPASQPRPAAPATAAPSTRPQPSARPVMSASGLSGLRIHSTPRAEETPASDAAPQSAPAPLRSEPFSEEALRGAWQTFYTNRPKEHILVNTMRASKIHRIEDTFYRMTVENQGQLDVMKAAMPDILKYLRDTLRNDSINFDIIVNLGESSPAIWSDREVFDHMRQTIPDLNNFISDFHLTLN